MSKVISRRGFLSSIAVLPWLPSLANSAVALPANVNAKVLSDIFINGHHDEAGKYFLSGFNLKGNERFRLALPQMPHSFAIDPQNSHRVVAFPGLPGTRAVVVNLNTGKQLATFNSRAGRHFNGHGVFSPNGKLLFSSENIIKNAEGIISVRETKNFSIVQEISGYGIGPHDIHLMPNGKTLVVASGGIATHPNTGKYELNINTMSTALLFIDSESGKLLAQRKMPDPKLSIRHLDVGKDGTVLVACQYKGRTKMPKLVGIQRGEGEIEMMDVDGDSLWQMNNYTASALIANKNIAAVTCPRGNRITFWDLQQKKLITSLKIKDAGAVEMSVDGRYFIVSANRGELFKIDVSSLQITKFSHVWQNVKWTNHMVNAVS